MLNPRQERFASLYATGKPAAVAYAESYGKNGHSAEASGARLLRNAEVAAQVESIQAKAREEAAVTLEWQVQWHKAVVETPVGQLHANHPLAQEVCIVEKTVLTDTGPVTTRMTRVKMPSKTDSQRELAKLLGHYRAPGEGPRPKAHTEGANEEEMTVRELMKHIVLPGSPIAHRLERAHSQKIGACGISFPEPEAHPLGA